MKPTLRLCLHALALSLLAHPFPALAKTSVGLVLKFRGGDFWTAFEEGAKEAAAAADVDLVIKGITDPGNYGVQQKLIESLVAQKADAIIVTPTNGEKLAGPLQELAAKGVKLVIAESPLPAGSGLPFVGIDQAKISSDAGVAFAKEVNEGDAVAMFRGVIADRVIAQREPVILAKLKEAHPNVRLYTDVYAVDDETTTAGQKAELLLQKHPDAKVYITTASGPTGNLMGAIKRLGVESKVKVCAFGTGLDAAMVQAIESGMVKVYVAQAAKDIGIKSVNAAIALTKGEKLPEKTDTAFYVVTKANLNDAAVKALVR